MGALLCDICGGELEMQVGGFAVCGSCGIKYNKDSLQEKVQNIKGIVTVQGAVETVKGSAELERLLKNAQKFIELQEFKKAYELLDEIITNFSDDYRGYLLMFELLIKIPKAVIFQEYDRQNGWGKFASQTIDLEEIEKCQRRVIAFCPEESLEIIEDKIKNIYSNLISAIKRGDRELSAKDVISFVNKEKSNLNIENLINAGNDMAEKVKKHCHPYRNISATNIDDDRILWWESLCNPICIIGKTVYFFNNTVPLAMRINESEYSGITKQIDNFVEGIISKGKEKQRCIYCKKNYHAKMKTTFWGKVSWLQQIDKNGVCIDCGRKQPKNIAELKEN